MKNVFEWAWDFGNYMNLTFSVSPPSKNLEPLEILGKSRFWAPRLGLQMIIWVVGRVLRLYKLKSYEYL